MSQTDVVIYVPYALEEAAGNSVTALRLRKQLIVSGLSVVLVTPRDEMVPARCLLALNAWRSAELIEDFDGPVLVMLTGTDINDERVGDSAWSGRRAMERANLLVVLQQAAVTRVPESLREKCRVILPSVDLPSGLEHVGSGSDKFQVILAARYREEKQPDFVLEACRLLEPDAAVEVSWYGAVAQQGAPHFQWKGAVSQGELWEEMSRADVFLNASSEEGGANAVCEAVALGLPVLASRIGGNIGLLGDDYAGYFDSDDPAALATLLACPPLEQLKCQIAMRQSAYSYERECDGWQQAVKSLL